MHPSKQGYPHSNFFLFFFIFSHFGIIFWGKLSYTPFLSLYLAYFSVLGIWVYISLP